MLMPFVLPIALLVPSAGKARPGALQGRTKQSQSIQKPQLMKQEEDYAITLTHEKGSVASHPGKVGATEWSNPGGKRTI